MHHVPSQGGLYLLLPLQRISCQPGSLAFHTDHGVFLLHRSYMTRVSLRHCPNEKPDAESAFTKEHHNNC
ncbi:hypothetical protein Hanom_Chr16g01505011 [Helianthus anomalus]